MNEKYRAQALTTAVIASGVTEFIRDRFQVQEDDSNFHADVHLWNEGYVDSLGIAELIAFIQREFGVVLPDDVFFDESNLTITGLARFTAGMIETAALRKAV